MEHLRIIRDIELKNFRPVYFLMGEEPYFIDLITDHIEKKVLGEAEKAFCQVIVYGRDVDMQAVINLAKGYPMMGDRQVVIVKEAQDMKDWRNEDELTSLENYLKNPTPSTLLVFAFKGKTIDKRKKLYKSIDKYGVAFESAKVKDYKLADWIEAYVAEHGYKIKPDASNMLAEYLGTNLTKVVNELNKLAIILPKGSLITPEIIEQNIGISKDYNSWELNNALSKKDIKKANMIINYFEANPKANPIQMVLPGLYSHFSKILMYQSLKNKNDASRELGINPYALNDLKQAATNYSPAKLERILSYLRETDKKTKGVDNYSVENGDLMKELVFKILH